jgi:hypothetical protein
MLNEAAFLWADLPPGLRKANTLHPERYAVACERAKQIIRAAEGGGIKYERPEIEITKNVSIPIADGWGRGRRSGSIPTKERVPVDWGDALFTRAALKGYADSIGERPAFLFPDAVEVSALRCLDKTDPHFSGELEAAILAWQYASERAEGSKKKPRALIVEWLQANRPQYDQRGNARERISTLANWEKTTGPKPLK